MKRKVDSNTFTLECTDDYELVGSKLHTAKLTSLKCRKILEHGKIRPIEISTFSYTNVKKQNVSSYIN